MDFDWSSTHQLGVLLLDWFLYNSNDTKAYDEMVQGLLDYFDKTSKKYEPKENLGLAFRLICYRYSRCDSEVKKKLVDQMKKLLLKVNHDIDDQFQFSAEIQSELVPKPALVEIVSAGPSDYDEVMFNRQSLKVIQCLYKSSANAHLGDTKMSVRFARAAYQLIAGVLWLNDEDEITASQNTQDSPLRKLVNRVRERKIDLEKKQAKMASIANQISDTDSDQTDVFDSQCLFQNTRLKNENSPSKSLLRTPTKKFAKRILKGQKWPVNTENVSEEEFDTKKVVTFAESNEVKEFSSQESTDVEIVSASDDGTLSNTQPSSTFMNMMKSREEGSSQENQAKRKSPSKSPQANKRKAYNAVANLA